MELFYEYYLYGITIIFIYFKTRYLSLHYIYFKYKAKDCIHIIYIIHLKPINLENMPSKFLI